MIDAHTDTHGQIDAERGHGYHQQFAIHRMEGNGHAEKNLFCVGVGENLLHGAELDFIRRGALKNPGSVLLNEGWLGKPALLRRWLFSGWRACRLGLRCAEA